MQRAGFTVVYQGSGFTTAAAAVATARAPKARAAPPLSPPKPDDCEMVFFSPEGEDYLFFFRGG